KDSSVTADIVTLQHNVAGADPEAAQFGGNGGAIYGDGPMDWGDGLSFPQFGGSLIANNSAVRGGAAYFTNTGGYFYNTTIAYNTADEGGAIKSEFDAGAEFDQATIARTVTHDA